MKCRYVFVEIHGEEVETSDASIESAMIVLEIVVKVIGCFCSYRTDLLVASCVARDKKYGNSKELSIYEFSNSTPMLKSGKWRYKPCLLARSLARGRDITSIWSQIEYARYRTRCSARMKDACRTYGTPLDPVGWLQVTAECP